MTSNLSLLIMMLVAGGMAAAQSALNAQLSRLIESPIQASFISFLFGTMVLSIILVFAKEGLPSVTRVVQVPPVYLVGGIFGVAFITTVIFLVPRIGVANVLFVGLAGQMVVSVMIDHFGWLGVRQQPVDLWRLAGLLLIIGGVLCLNRRVFE